MNAHNLQATTDTAPRLPNLTSGGVARAIIPQDFEGAWRIANAVCKAGMAPKGLDTPEKAMVAILHGLELGLAPMTALQRIAVVNGRPTIWGDGAMSLVRGSGACEWVKERIEGVGDQRVAICEAKRKGEPEPISRKFSVADAKTAGLWGKAGPWQQYPERMLQMRARAFALRDGFADVLGGLYLAEEIQGTEPMRDVTPPRPPSPPSPPPPPRQQVAASPSPTEAATEPQAQNDPRILPSSEDPGVWLAALDRILTSFPDDQGEAAVQWLDDVVEPIIDTLMPPDQEEALSVRRKHERRWC